MDEDNTTKPTRASTEPKPTSELSYDSNPFTMGWSNVQKLLKINPHTMVGLAFFNVLIFVILGVLAVVMIFTIVTLWRRTNPQEVLPIGILDLETFSSVASGVLIGTLIIGFALIIAIAALIQILQARLAIASAKNITLKFGQLIKDSMPSILPVLGYGAMTFGVILGAILILSVLAQFIGYATLAVALVAILAAIYIGLRLSFVAYVIVDEKVGPIQAIKRSWAITREHLIETLGAAIVSWLVLAVPSVIVSAAARLTEGSPGLSQAFDLLEVIFSIILVVVAAMPLAGRYVQLQAVANKKVTPSSLSPMNYVAILLFVAIGPLLSALSPQTNNQSSPFGPDYGVPTGRGDESSDMPLRLQ